MEIIMRADLPIDDKISGGGQSFIYGFSKQLARNFKQIINDKPQRRTRSIPIGSPFSDAPKNRT
ncbi:hypothetical protein [Pseudoramibacter alactolyticus]